MLGELPTLYLEEDCTMRLRAARAPATVRTR